MFASPVVEASQLTDILLIPHKSLVNGIHRVFKRKRTLELACFYFKERQLLPLYIHVNHSRTIA